MPRDPVRNSLVFFSVLIMFLILAVAFAARAQVTGSVNPMFQPAMNYSSGGFSASSVAVADLNGDG
ncbi:MAG: hypothetical protein DMG81_03245, partial [Acidobacteria bacterium]